MAHTMFLVNVPCALEKNVYSAAVIRSFLLMSIKSHWVISVFKSSVSLVVFCLNFSVSYEQRGVDIVEHNCGFVSFSLRFFSFCFSYIEALIRCIFRAVMSSCWMSLLFIMKLTVCIPGINPTWSQCMIFLYMVEFSLLILCWGFLHLYSSETLVSNFLCDIFFLFLADCAVLPVGS